MSDTDPVARRLLSRKTVAAACDFSVGKVDGLISVGKLEAVRSEKQVRITSESFDRYLASLPRADAAQVDRSFRAARVRAPKTTRTTGKAKATTIAATDQASE